jgi:hypothetical protein
VNEESADWFHGYSFPSGHASSAASGLIYLSLFLASKLNVTIPFLASTGYPADESSFSAFPSRLVPKRKTGQLRKEEETLPSTTPDGSGLETAETEAAEGNDRIFAHEKALTAVRRQAAAAPLYLLIVTLLPTFAAIFIGASRWPDYRHHAADIVTGLLIGALTSYFSFRYYHLPISQGAGWGWGPRHSDKAFWAGVGSYSYATAGESGGSDSVGGRRAEDEEEGFGNKNGNGAATATRNGMKELRGGLPHSLGSSSGVQT